MHLGKTPDKSDRGPQESSDKQQYKTEVGGDNHNRSRFDYEPNDENDGRHCLQLKITTINCVMLKKIN